MVLIIVFPRLAPWAIIARRSAAGKCALRPPPLPPHPLSNYNTGMSRRSILGRWSTHPAARLAFPGILLVLAVCLAYLPVWHAGFIWDDDYYVTANRLLTAPDGWYRIWFSWDSPSQYFPLTYTWFRFERDWWGLQPAGYHAMNLLLHAANALLLWRLLKRLDVPGSWLAAALFALHPVQVESVAWVSELRTC